MTAALIGIGVVGGLICIVAPMAVAGPAMAAGGFSATGPVAGKHASKLGPRPDSGSVKLMFSMLFNFRFICRGHSIRHWQRGSRQCVRHHTGCRDGRSWSCGGGWSRTGYRWCHDRNYWKRSGLHEVSLVRIVELGLERWHTGCAFGEPRARSSLADDMVHNKKQLIVSRIVVESCPRHAAGMSLGIEDHSINDYSGCPSGTINRSWCVVASFGVEAVGVILMETA